MHLELLLEEPSAQRALDYLVRAIVGDGVSVCPHVFRGKADLMRSLPKRLAGYRYWQPEGYIVVVLVDADDQDCRQLKSEMEQCAQQAGLRTPSATSSNTQVQVINRIAVQELESWYFGDPEALRAAFPRLPASIGTRPKYRNPDEIPNTWETLERELKRKGYYSTGLQKIDLAERVAPHMDPEINCSASFRAFRDALRTYALDCSLADS